MYSYRQDLGQWTIIVLLSVATQGEGLHFGLVLELDGSLVQERWNDISINFLNDLKSSSLSGF